MSPPSYSDLGKVARDLFSKEFSAGFIKIDSTTKAGEEKNVEFKTGATHTVASGRLAGSLDVKYKIPSCGVTLTEKWNTNNELGTVLEVEDQFARGLKVTLDSSYTPQVGKRTGKLKTQWGSDLLKLNCDVGLDMGPIVTLSGVVARHGWLVGVQTTLDAANSKLKGTNVAFGHVHPTYTIHSFVNDANEFGASLFHKAAHNVEVGAQLGWMVSDQSARFGLVGKYCPGPDLELKAKIDNQSRVAIAATHRLSEQLKLVLSTQFGLNTLNEGGHKFGFGLNYSQ